MLLFWAVVVILALAVVLIFNRLVRSNYMVKEAWSGIQVQLKRRYDLIPNLVETVKGYRSHEQQVFTQVTEARARCLNARDVKETVAAENDLGRALKSLFAVAEAYPELKASRNFSELQKSLSDIEEQLQMARRYYNAVVRDFNTAVEQFPSNLIASHYRFEKRDFFELETPEIERKPVKVSF